MASTTLRYDLTWENGVSVKLSRREDAGDPVTLFEMEENGELVTVWSHISTILEAIFAAGVKRAGDEMAG